MKKEVLRYSSELKKQMKSPTATASIVFLLIQIETEIILSQSLFLLLTNLSVFFKKFSYKTVSILS